MLAIIPARGGSKGLPGKNIKELNGIPLIAYTIQAAREAPCIERVIVTTDDEKIAATARKYGAEVPFLRPEYLASDTSSAIDVYIHAAEYIMNEQNAEMDKFMVLLPTAPLRTSRHIEEAYKKFVECGARTLISVKVADVPPSWYLYRNQSDHIFNCGFGLNNGFVYNRQMDQDYYLPNGAIYILDYKLLKEERTYYCDNTTPYIMGGKESTDIDTIDDFEYAEFLIKKSRAGLR